MVIVIASDNLKYSSDTENVSCGNAGLYALCKSIILTQAISGSIRVKFDLASYYVALPVYGKIYHNGVPVGTERTTNSETYVTFTEDLPVNYALNDTIELWGHCQFGCVAKVRNFRIEFDIPLVVNKSAFFLMF